MAGRTGADGQVGFGVETTWGTGVTPTRFLPFLSEEVKLDNPLLRSAGIRAGSSRVLGTDRVVANPKGGAGNLSSEVANKGYSMLLKHSFGSTVITTPTGGTLTRDHTSVLADPTGLGLTYQAGRPSLDNTVNAFTYPGCKIATWEFAQEIDGFLQMTLGLDAKTEDTVTALASASYPSAMTIFHWQHCSVTIDGSPYIPQSITISGDNGIKTDRYGLAATGAKREQLPNNFIVVTGTIAGEFFSTAQYAKFVSGQAVSLVFKWEMPTAIEGSFKYTLQFTIPSAKFTGETPSVTGPDFLENPLPFEMFYDGAQTPLTVLYRTTDSVI